MRRKDGSTDDWPDPEFEPPPRVGPGVERRLAGRAATLWHERRGDGAMPPAPGYDAGGRAAPRRDLTANSIMLGIDGEAAVVAAVSPDVAAAFGLACGPLAATADGSLAARLAAAARTLRERPGALAIDGLLTAAGADAATLLTRGVALPLAGPGGEVVAAHVVVTWKEMLSADACDRLRRELERVPRFIAPGRRDDAFALSVPRGRR